MKFLFLMTFLFSKTVWSMDFDCQKSIEENETYSHCVNQYSFYPNPIHFFIPKKIEIQNSLHLFIHFHGHNLEGANHFKRTDIPGAGFGDYGYFLTQAKSNGILVIPESKGNCTTYDQFFSDDKNTDNFLERIKELTHNPSKLHLSGHSGAYRVLNRITSQFMNNDVTVYPTISSIGLFDAIYGNIDSIESWLEYKVSKEASFYFLAAFVSGKFGTTEELSLLLRKKSAKLNSTHIEFKHIKSNDSETLLLQHFNTLKNGSLTHFFEMSSKIF